MKKLMARFALISAAVLTLGSVLASAGTANVKKVQAFGPRRPPVEQALGAKGNEGRWWNNPRIVEQLKLTDDQQKAMDQIFYDHRTRLIDLHASLEKAELAMQQLMKADQPDQKAMEAQIEKVVAARGDMERANSRFLLAVRLKLTPDQWKQLRESRGLGMAAPAPSKPMQQFRDRKGKGVAPPPAPPASAPGMRQQ